jgi:hypothetical protein
MSEASAPKEEKKKDQDGKKGKKEPKVNKIPGMLEENSQWWDLEPRLG